MKNGRKWLLEMFEKAEEQALEGPTTDLLQILNGLFFSIIRVDLKNDAARIKQSVDFPESVEKTVIWTDYLENYRYFMKTDEVDSFRSEKLLEIYKSGQKAFAKDIPYIVNNSKEWLTVEAFLDTADTEMGNGGAASESDSGKVYATIVVRQSSKEHLQKSIIDLYVYNSCDCFIYLDARNNSYTMFSGADNGTPLPAAVCKDYSAEMVKYADAFVALEDRERVKNEMWLEHVQERLEQGDTYSFTYGIIDPVRGYTRKCLEYRYYDRLEQMILLCRTDITELYMDEKKKREELELALRRACTDSLTGLLNHQGIVDAVSECLTGAHRHAALMVIDLDDFKCVNDSFGHVTGDKLLCRIGDTLKSLLKPGDLTGRIGGDEFLVFFNEIHSAEEAMQRAKQVCDAVYQLSFTAEYQISCSIGAAIYPEEGTDYITLMECADRRAYYAKRNGKNQVSMD